MGAPKAQKPNGQFLTGLAWTFLIVAGWASIRLIIWLLLAFRTTSASDPTILGLSDSASKVFMVLHLGLAIATLFAAKSLLKRHAWTQIFFVVLLFLIMIEAGIFARNLAFGSQELESSKLSSKLKGIKYATSGAMLLLGIVAGLVGWKLLRFKRF